jgi:hypothetical protein
MSHSRRRWTARWLLAAVTVLAMVSAVAAQTGDRVREEVARTDEILERAAAVVRESESLRARELLDRAVQIQREARLNLEAARLLIAGRLTLEARGLAARALTLAREETATRSRAEREMERAARALDLARETLREVPPPASRVLMEATALLERSRTSFREQQYNASLRLALAAQRLVAQALAHGPVGGPRLQRELERTDHVLERVREIEAALPQAQVEALARAVNLQDAAWAAFRDRRAEEAASRTREARTIALRVRSESGPLVDDAAVGDALRETQVLLDRAADVIGGADDGRAAMLLERAQEHQHRARAMLESGHLRPALAQTRVARNLAARAIEQSASGEVD